MTFEIASVDSALQKLEAAGRPIRVAMVGAGATGRAIALQLATPVPGMRLVAIANRTPEHVSVLESRGLRLRAVPQ